MPAVSSPAGSRLSLTCPTPSEGGAADALTTIDGVAWDSLTAEQQELRELVRSVAAERVAPRAAEIDPGRVPVGRRRGAPGAGHPRATVRGGARRHGTGSLMLLVAIEELSKVCATTGLILAVQEPRLRSRSSLRGTAEQKEPPPSRGWPPASRSRAYALTERGLGLGRGRDAHDSRRPRRRRVRARTDRSGSSRTPASHSSYTVFAKTDPDAGHRGISCFLVEADTPGFEVGRIEPKMGIKGSTTGELVFERTVRVPADRLIGEEGDGFRIAMRVLDRSRPGVGAQALGLAQGATDYALEYARTPRDVRQADRGAPARRARCSPTWRRARGGARARSTGSAHDRRRRRRPRADEDRRRWRS